MELIPSDLLFEYCGECGDWNHAGVALGATYDHEFVHRHGNPDFCQRCWVKVPNHQENCPVEIEIVERLTRYGDEARVRINELYGDDDHVR